MNSVGLGRPSSSRPSGQALRRLEAGLPRPRPPAATRGADGPGPSVAAAAAHLASSPVRGGKPSASQSPSPYCQVAARADLLQLSEQIQVSPGVSNVLRAAALHARKWGLAHLNDDRSSDFSCLRCELNIAGLPHRTCFDKNRHGKRLQHLLSISGNCCRQ
jgi:hypothetical protein